MNNVLETEAFLDRFVFYFVVQTKGNSSCDGKRKVGNV